MTGEFLCKAGAPMETSVNLSELLRAAQANLQAGQWALAERCCQQLLRQQPGQPDALHMLGICALQQGRAAQAAEFLGQAVAAAGKPAPLLLLHWSMALHGAGRLPEAVTAYQRVLALAPELVEARHNLGRVFKDMGRLDEAADCFREAVRRQPGLALSWFSLGVVQQARGLPAEAAASFRHALEAQPRFPEAHFNLGEMQRQRGELEAAAASYEAALGQQAALAPARFALGLVRQAQERWAEALASYDAFLTAQPGNADAWNNRGVALRQLGRLEEATASFERASQLQPGLMLALSNRGDVLHLLGRFAEAEACFRQALALDAGRAHVHASLGAALLQQDRCAEADAALQEALSLDPDLPISLANRGLVAVRQGRIDDALAALRQAVQMLPDDIALASSQFMPMQYTDTITPAEVFAAQRRYGDLVESTLPPPAPHTNSREPQRRLRIGYVSPDFRDHAVNFFFEPVLRAHDREQVEVFCYYTFGREDAVSARLKTMASHWRLCRGLSDEELAAQIRADRIDILVDLAGHTALNRLPVFARHPAPVQITWMGYLGSTGLRAMDYRLTDAWLDPPGQTGALHTEELLYLPAWAVFGPVADAPAVNELPALGGAPFTFACLNNLAKINHRVVALWARILAALPTARLVLGNAQEAEVRARLEREFTAAGVAPERVEFLPKMPLPEFLAQHRRFDLALDPFPFNGGVTTGHALWMGVPVVTLAGASTVSRQGAALLQALDLGELVATSEEDYRDRVLALARDLPRLQALRQSLRERMAPEARAGALTRALEQTYRQVWVRWCENQTPEAS